MIPGLGPIRWLVVYFGASLVGAVAMANAAKYTARSFFKSKSRGTRKTLSSSSRGPQSEEPS